jgi:hypothetical protein
MLLTPGGEGVAPLAAAEEAGEVARLEAVQQAGLPHPRVPEEFDLDLGDGRGRGDQLFDVLVGPAVDLQPVEQVACKTTYIIMEISLGEWRRINVLYECD